MTTRAPSRRRFLGALFLLPVFACSDTPPAKLYTLAPRAATPLRRPPASVSVTQVAVAKYLDRPQLVRYSDPYQMSAAEYERWGEGMSDMVTRVLVDNLSQRLPGSQIYAASGPLTLPNAEFTVEVNVDKFDAGSDGIIILVAQWVIHSGKGRSQFSAQEIRVAPPSPDAAGQVAAMSDALAQLSSQIAAGIATYVPESGTHQTGTRSSVRH
jgi:uncharacterized lipoprotein YmbA